MNNKKSMLRLVFSALFLAVAMVLPFFTGQIPEIGRMLCPMHIPIILCGFVCSWQWGLAVGFVAPVLRSLVMGGMPPMFPVAICMSFELAMYGLVAGLLYRMLPKKKICIYVSLFVAMLLGRVVWGIAMFFCMGLSGSDFGFGAFLTGAFANSLPGIVVQVLLIPVMVMLLENTRLIKAVADK